MTIAHALTAAGIILVVTGCAAFGPPLTTWEDDRNAGIRTSSRAAERVTFETTEAIRKLVATPIDPRSERPPIEEVAQRLEMSMLRFTSEVRILAGRLRAEKHRPRPKAPPSWPEPIQAVFKRLLDELDDGLAVAPDELVPKRTLLQAHVTTEAERETAERQFGPCPPNLAWRIDDLHLAVRRLLERNRVALADSDSPKWREHGAPPLQWPVSPLIYTSFYGYRQDPMTGAVRFHTGIDLGTPLGEVINASGPGRVVHAGWAGGYGRMVVLQHPSGYQTLYAHLSQLLVGYGVEVESGAPVGLAGASGRSTGPHLHFEVRQGGRPIDPMAIVGRVHATAEKTSRRTDRARGSVRVVAVR